MGRGERTSVLHMRPQIPELLQANAGYIYYIIALRNGCIWVISIAERSAQGHYKA
jgi:hypothetical protein